MRTFFVTAGNQGERSVLALARGQTALRQRYLAWLNLATSRITLFYHDPSR